MPGYQVHSALAQCISIWPGYQVHGTLSVIYLQQFLKYWVFNSISSSYVKVSSFQVHVDGDDNLVIIRVGRDKTDCFRNLGDCYDRLNAPENLS